MKNKSYIGISFIILIFGIIVIPKIIDRVSKDDIVKGDRLNTVDGKGNESGLYTMGVAPEFELTNQDNVKITNADYKGKVFVLEFFFSTCPTICPKMNANLKSVQQAFFGNRSFGIASITINPEHDTPKVLKEHRDALGITSENWHFLTGDKAYIFNLANKGFNLYAGQSQDKFNGGFEHSGLFALIDKKGNIRCRNDEFGNPILYYDGLEEKGIKALKQDIKNFTRRIMENVAVEKKYNVWIIILSVLIPVVVAVLFTVKLKDFGIQVEPLSFLPPIYATINAITALLLVSAVRAVKSGNRALHERLMKIAIACSVAFLAMYVAYHMTADATKFGGEGILKYVYYFILLTHILLSVAVIPFVLISYVRGISGNFERHKKISRITYPLWLYVAVTGVIVYLMISPYYVH